MLRQIGEIVARARGREKLPLDQLARQVGVSPATLQSLERGEPGLSTAALDRLARHLGLDGAALLLGQERPQPRVSVFLRHSGMQDFNHDAQEALERALEAGRMLRSLNERLGVERLARPVGAALRNAGPSAALEGYNLAQVWRRHLQMPSQPMGDLGVLLEERFEVAVLVAALGSTAVSAAGLRGADAAAAVVLNAAHPELCANPPLARVHLAHELCHILHDPSEGGLHLVIERDREVKVRQRVARAEQRAKAFAAELLLPQTGLLELLGPTARTASPGEGRALVASARRHFGTPWEITVNHLNHRDYLANDVRETLLRQGPQGTPVGAASTRLPPPGGPSIALGDRVRRAHEDGTLTDGQVRVALGLSASEALPWG
ncbi:MAG: ImmA/IrrE family metallo-endopeptidase [Deltaproteobacteria bacterium]|nr:ImmA/IrrE family metallo-endopeptidase [Deltaproteobacteria bacterium]